MSDLVWPELSFPPDEARFLRDTYNSARIILEYGSGGSTILASKSPEKLIFSVESDRSWALRLQREIDSHDLPSPAIVYHVDIGPTGEWGRPMGPEYWNLFFRYPLSVWSEPFFRQPDVVLIDGRFRPACLMAVLMCTVKPVKVLFDDYVSRPVYHSVEAFLKPIEFVGRMAVFEARPTSLDHSNVVEAMEHFFRATYHGRGPIRYSV